MSMNSSSRRAYEAPHLRPLGSVHELTQTKTLGLGDALLWHGSSGGGGGGAVSNGS